jgi:sugar phosphate isomerase/epimerase
MSLHTRRDFTKLALTTLCSASAGLRAAEAAKPNSKVNGVQLGLNVPYSFHEPLMTGDEILARCLQLGLSGVELRTQPVETFLGVPPELVRPDKKASKEEKAALADKLREWRKGVSMDKVKEFRSKYESAGVLIEIVKVDNIIKMSDDEIDYSFALAKALGGRAISTEISHEVAEVKRLGGFADKHEFLVGYHGHATTKPEHWEAAFDVAKFNGANVDIGHFIAGNNTSPVPFITKYHDRVTHVHIKDRKFNNGPNTPFGQGDTPIVDVLHLLRENKWPIQATLEFEYKIPEGSDRMTELNKAIKFCRDALA